MGGRRLGRSDNAVRLRANFARARRIDQEQLLSFQCEPASDVISRGTGHFGDNGRVAAGQ